jgi:hypothetical protein
MRAIIIISLLALVIVCSCSESEKSDRDNAKPQIDTSEVIKDLPVYLEVDFKTFNLALWGCEKIESNRNWETYNDSVYLTVNKSTDSILIFETHGIEELVLTEQHELSKRVRGKDGTNLDLVDWVHEYLVLDTLSMINFQFKPTPISVEPKFKSELNQDSLDYQILKIENEIGLANWSVTKSEGYQVQDYISRTFYRINAVYNNGDSAEKIVILHYAN